MPELFDMKLRALRRDRAASIGPELFLLDRAFDDCLERIALMNRRFGRALLVGCPNPEWRQRLSRTVNNVEVIDPGSLFASAAGGRAAIEDQWIGDPGSFDLVLTVGTLDTVNDLPRALLGVRHALAPDGLLIGAMSGADTLPQLRKAMRAADEAMGVGASAHVHPRVEAAALAGLLGAAGFAMPVVDVDRVQVGYRAFDRLVADLRAMGATNILNDRSRRPLTRASRDAAINSFGADAIDGKTTEVFEILHFAGWVPGTNVPRDQG